MKNTSMPRSTKLGKNQRGNLLLEAMLGIALAGAGFLAYYEIEHQITNRKQFSKVTSDMYQQYNVFLSALEQYAQKSNSTQVVTCQELKNGYLASNFNCTDYLGDTLEGILIKNQTQTPTAYVVGIPSTSSQNMLNSYNVSSIQVLNQTLAQSQPENTTHGFFVVNTNNYIGYPVVDISQTMSFSTVASYLPKQGLNLSNNSYVIALVDTSTLNPSAAPPSCTSSSSILNPPGTWTYSFTNHSVISYLPVVSVTDCSYTEWQPYQSCTYVNGQVSTSNNGAPFSTSSCSLVTGNCPKGYIWNPNYGTCINNTQYTMACYPPYVNAWTTGPTGVVICAYWPNDACPPNTMIDYYGFNGWRCVYAPDDHYECPPGYSLSIWYNSPGYANGLCIANNWIPCPDYNVYQLAKSAGMSCYFTNWCAIQCLSNNGSVLLSVGAYGPSTGTAETNPSSPYYGYYHPSTLPTISGPSPITVVNPTGTCPVDSAGHQGFHPTPQDPGCADYGFFDNVATPLSCPAGEYFNPNTGTCQY